MAMVHSLLWFGISCVPVDNYDTEWMSNDRPEMLNNLSTLAKTPVTIHLHCLTWSVGGIIIVSTILVADDETEIVDLLRDYLEADGFTVIGVGDGDAALQAALSTPVDCILLDVMMPGKTGFEACRLIREHCDVPILFLSARQSDVDKIRGLGLGGDDYVGKPFSPGEVVARVKAVLRRYQRGAPPQESPRLRCGRLEIDVKAHQAYMVGEPVYLTAKEYELLLFLAEHPRQVFTREQLFARIWGDFGDLHTVTVHIARIREKLEADPAKPALIATVWGVGYRFEGERS
jgi:DNA-binding response OmpR family regulator